ncbi:glycosyltransferase family 4 protein [Cerasicoccus maritimus]|uniref:glycosyltransferase family 4 protein n=1 Tax=Cerasicoccus maritimus TaxID=490089 RepID=UPI002852758D|nr:glycosyltransferase family 4 protein [Cerasicoccus maritimus]
MKVWLQQFVFVHYRRRIFGRLADLVGSESITFLGGIEARESGLVIVDSIPLRNGVSHPVVPLKNHFCKSGWSWQSSFLHRTVFGDYDVLILQGDAYLLSNWIAQIIALLRRKRVLLWTHGIYGSESRLKRWVRLVYLRLSSGLLLYGNHARLLLEGHWFRSDQLYVVYNSADSVGGQDLSIVERERLGREIFPQKPDKVVVFIGRLTVVKQLTLLLEATAQLISYGESINVLLVGDGPEKERLENDVRKLGLESNIIFYGACYDAMRVSALMGLADVCVSPGNVGLTAISALEAGTPVITHGNACKQMPEYEAIIPGETGIFFNEGDAVDLARVMSQWFTHKTDRQAVAQRCKEVVAHYFHEDVQIKVIAGAIEGKPASQYPRRNPVTA